MVAFESRAVGEAFKGLESKGLKILVSPVRFLVAPLFKKEKRCKSLNFKGVRGFFFSKNRQN
ncbi:hypothetical protein DWW83_15655 [Bacteroides uniformis]|uniref:Uncharacterized protein n=1 Tax=Bacteroides uniformis TaxID=820 RepID=A0A412SIL0_BACUN|nr:hypothetical protein DWW83_15655 [Bacteroides uniformis]